MEQKTDRETWERKGIFDFFSGMSNPFYMVTFRQDVTKLYKYAKRNGISFYYALVYLCTKAINGVPAFHYAISIDKTESLVRPLLENILQENNNKDVSGLNCFVFLNWHPAVLRLSGTPFCSPTQLAQV